jgi:saccharopine dehydrogenase-like NADP-dependent oxidoreductase
MKKEFSVALYGAGKVGDAICALLSNSGCYAVELCDSNWDRTQLVASRWKNITPRKIDLANGSENQEILKNVDAVISALPFYCNSKVVEYAAHAKVPYFDLTEDIATTQAVTEIAKRCEILCMPQCGLAPGFISIVAAHLVKLFDSVTSLKMRVGALPIYPTNQLKYNLSWSTEGLINEYCNECEVIIHGKRQFVQPLEGYEIISLDGVEYEAFNTSGGLGSLCQTLEGKVQSLSYKSIRYPGHRDLIAFLLHDLRFHDDRDTLRRVLERGIPETPQDKCIIFVEARGTIDGLFTQRAYASTIYHKNIAGKNFSAIQLTTAAGICGAVDLCLTKKLVRSSGIVKSEEIPLSLFLENEFGREYHDEAAALPLLTKR